MVFMYMRLLKGLVFSFVVAPRFFWLFSFFPYFNFYTFFCVFHRGMNGTQPLLPIVNRVNFCGNKKAPHIHRDRNTSQNYAENVEVPKTDCELLLLILQPPHEYKTTSMIFSGYYSNLLREFYRKVCRILSLII